MEKFFEVIFLHTINKACRSYILANILPFNIYYWHKNRESFLHSP